MEVSEVSEVKSGFFLQLSVQLVVRVDLDLLTLEILHWAAFHFCVCVSIFVSVESLEVLSSWLGWIREWNKGLTCH